MKGWRMALGVAVALVVAVLFSHGIDAHTLTVNGHAVPLGMAMIAPLIIPRTKQQLAELANPTQPGQSEVVPWILFDTQTYTSGTTTVLNYFAAQQSDRTLSNMLQGGALTDPQWFEVYNLGFDILTDASLAGASTEVGVLDDIAKLMLVARPVFTLTISDKNYGPFPLSFLHTSGGPQGVIGATLTAPNAVQSGNNSFPDGGWNWRGSVIIPPKVGFSVQVQYSAAQTLNIGNTPLRFWMAGALHRRIV